MKRWLKILLIVIFVLALLIFIPKPYANIQTERMCVYNQGWCIGLTLPSKIVFAGFSDQSFEGWACMGYSFADFQILC